MNTECYVEIPADKLREAVALAYEMSSPQGLGFLDAKDGGLPDEDIDEIIASEYGGSWIAASMDYIHGRSCKFSVYREGERLFVSPHWYDHTDYALADLLQRLGILNPAERMAAARDAERAAHEAWMRENAPNGAETV